jgi:hypothetical protein
MKFSVCLPTGFEGVMHPIPAGATWGRRPLVNPPSQFAPLES